MRPPRNVLIAKYDGSDPLVANEDREYWAFQPPVRPDVPHVEHQDRVRNPVDAFLLEKLEAANPEKGGLSFAPEADRLAKEFRRRGKLVVAGGPHASFSSEEVLEHCDSVVIGEAEGVWQQMLADAQSGCLQKVYKGRLPALDAVPTPPPPGSEDEAVNNAWKKYCNARYCEGYGGQIVGRTADTLTVSINNNTRYIWYAVYGEPGNYTVNMYAKYSAGCCCKYPSCSPYVL